jgi:hypothetical protein
VRDEARWLLSSRPPPPFSKAPAECLYLPSFLTKMSETCCEKFGVWSRFLLLGLCGAGVRYGMLPRRRGLEFPPGYPSSALSSSATEAL